MSTLLPPASVSAAANQLRGAVRVVVLDGDLKSPQLNIHQVPQLLDGFITGLHGVNPAIFCSMVEKLDDVHIALPRRKIFEYCNIARNIITE